MKPFLFCAMVVSVMLMFVVYQFAERRWVTIEWCEESHIRYYNLASVHAEAAVEGITLDKNLETRGYEICDSYGIRCKAMEDFKHWLRCPKDSACGALVCNGTGPCTDLTDLMGKP